MDPDLQVSHRTIRIKIPALQERVVQGTQRKFVAVLSKAKKHRPENYLGKIVAFEFKESQFWFRVINILQYQSFEELMKDNQHDWQDIIPALSYDVALYQLENLHRSKKARTSDHSIWLIEAEPHVSDGRTINIG